MEIRALRYVVTLAEELHFGRAAKRHFISAQPFGLTVQRLEGELATRLFERSSRRVSLTSAGARFVERARVVLAELEGLRQIAAEEPGRDAGVRVGVLGFGAADCWQALRDAVGVQQPGLSLQYCDLDLTDQYDAVRRGEVDVAVVQFVGELDGDTFDPVHLGGDRAEHGHGPTRVRRLPAARHRPDPVLRHHLAQQRRPVQPAAPGPGLQAVGRHRGDQPGRRRPGPGLDHRSPYGSGRLQRSRHGWPRSCLISSRRPRWSRTTTDGPRTPRGGQCGNASALCSTRNGLTTGSAGVTWTNCRIRVHERTLFVRPAAFAGQRRGSRAGYVDPARRPTIAAARQPAQ
jgi:DNA-binding transcriptional LysR family regulator